MYQKFKAWLLKQLSTPEKIAAPAHSTRATGQIDHENDQHVVPYDENLLERSRTQWQFGDWESLTTINRDNPYGDVQAAGRIRDILKETALC